MSRKLTGNITLAYGVIRTVLPGKSLDGAQGVGAANTSPDYPLTRNQDYIDFDSSRETPTGNENSPRTLSVNYWRRTS